MWIKETLLCIEPTTTSMAHVKAAASLAASQGATVTALYIHPLRELPLAAQLQMPKLQELLEEEDRACAKKARELTEALVEGYEVSFQWDEVRGPAEEVFVRRAQSADLVIVGALAEPDGGMVNRLVGQLVLHAGRPVLVVPEAADGQSFGKRALVGWNGSREATRAVHDALPILRKAQWVKLLMVVASSRPASMANEGFGMRICGHLHKHNVAATPLTVEMHPTVGVDGLLLSEAEADQADMIVIGAYGRSHLRDVVLGGVTNAIVTQSKVPILLSH